MSDYTFEQYDDPRETRSWYERFLREHNGRDWQRKLRFSLADLLAGNAPTAPNGQTTRVFWYRVKYRGVLIGYADAKIHPFFNGRKVISDMWILPSFRKRGHFHMSFIELAEHIGADGICIAMGKYRLYGGWFESLGSDWLTAFGVRSNDDPDISTLFLVTRDAYKDMIRFALKYVNSRFGPTNERAALVVEEVRKELEAEDARHS